MDTWALKDRAEQFFRKGRWRRSLDAFEELIFREPEDARLRVRSGELLRRLNRPLEAARSYCFAGYLYRSQGYRARARAAMHMAMQLAPGEAELAVKLKRLEELLAMTPELRSPDERDPAPPRLTGPEPGYFSGPAA